MLGSGWGLRSLGRRIVVPAGRPTAPKPHMGAVILSESQSGTAPCTCGERGGCMGAELHLHHVTGMHSPVVSVLKRVVELRGLGGQPGVLEPNPEHDGEHRPADRRGPKAVLKGTHHLEPRQHVRNAMARIGFLGSAAEGYDDGKFLAGRTSALFIGLCDAGAAAGTEPVGHLRVGMA